MASDETADVTAPIATEEAAPGSGPTEPESAPAAPRRTTALPWVLAGLFLLVAAVMAIVAANLNGELDEDGGDRTDIESVAGRFGEALLSYDHNDPEGTKARVLELAAGALENEFEEAFPGLQALFAEAQGVATATVTGVWVGEIDGNTASAIVAADRLITGTAGPRTETNSYMRLDLVKTDGEWKVVGVSNLNLALSTESLESTTTTTSAAP